MSLERSNGTYQLLAHVSDVNLGNNVDTLKRSTETVTDASKVFGVNVNAEKTKEALLPRYQNTR
jgi:hypothetical protein